MVTKKSDLARWMFENDTPAWKLAALVGISRQHIYNVLRGRAGKLACLAVARHTGLSLEAVMFPGGTRWFEEEKK